MVLPELFCSVGDMQYSHSHLYERTYIEHQIPEGADECLIRLRDGINTYTKLIEIK